MTVTFQGMDTDRAQQLSESMNQLSRDTANASTSISTALTSMKWTGDDADHFRNTLTQCTIPALESLAESLDTFASSLTTQRSQQVTASQKDTGPWQAHGNGSFGTPPTLGKEDDRPYWSVAGLASSGLETGARELHHLALKAKDLAALHPTTDAIYQQVEKYGDSVLNPSHDESMITGVESNEGDPTAQSTADLVMNIQEARNQAGGGPEKENVRIQQVLTASGDTAYVVYIPPTAGGFQNLSAWDGSQGNTRDWRAVFDLAQGEETSAVKNVKKAMDVAGVPKGAPVMLVGHSQGGEIAGYLAGDESFNGKDGYNVAEVLSVGGPAEHAQPAHSHTNVTELQHRDKEGFMVWEEKKFLGLKYQVPALNDDIDADPIGATDFGGLGITTGPLGVPVPTMGSDSVDTVYFEGHEANGSMLNPKGDSFFANHDLYRANPDGTVDLDYGYAGSLYGAEKNNPEIKELEARYNGTFMGEGVTVVDDTTVTFDRTPLS